MEAIDIDVAGVLTNLGIAGAAVLGIAIVSFSWRKVVGFFSGR